MSLVSVYFALFVLAVLILYYALPQKYQWIVLLAASYFYYIVTCNRFVIYMIVTTLSTYAAGLLIEKIASSAAETLSSNKEIWSREEKKTFRQKVQTRKRVLLACALLFNFGILAFLKYFNFAAESVNAVLQACGITFALPEFRLLLPLGISFYTFQAMGYIIDVYRGKFAAERNPARFALFVSFFPQIIQGPIAFYSDLAHQLYAKHPLRYEALKNGALLIVWGLFKKLIIADRAVYMIDTVSGDYSNFPGVFILLSALMFALQLYADFSGGIDICRGVAEMLGIEMAENFRRPYFSRSLTEYWHRWHITLGAWLRNYLFYPISISALFLDWSKKLKKVNKHLGKVLPTCIASLITFLVIGIWHGANWKYVAFGFWNGMVIMLAELCQPLLDKLTVSLHINKASRGYGLFAMLRTFIIVLIGYYFDIAADLKGALQMMYLSVTDIHLHDLLDWSCLQASQLDVFDYSIIVVCGLVVLIASVIQERSGRTIRSLLEERPLILQWLVILAGVFSVIVFGMYGPGLDPAEFVYMQF